MKLAVGMYVRTDEGIRKILNEYEEGYELDRSLHYLYPEGHDLYKKDLEDDEDKIVIKASFNIIDLVEEGDILEINEEKYEVIYDESYEKLGILIPSRKELSIRHSALEYVFKKYEVAIVTKEQFEQAKYKVGE